MRLKLHITKTHLNFLYDPPSEVNTENGRANRRTSLPLPRVLLKTVVDVRNQSQLAIVVSDIIWYVEDGRRLKNNLFTGNWLLD